MLGALCRTGALILLCWCCVFLVVPVVQAQAVPVPTVKIGLADGGNPEEITTTLQIVFVLTILTLAPSILMMMTSFTRIIIIFSFLRNAMQTQQMPSNQVMVGMALFLTFFIMTPVWQKIDEKALQPYIAEEINFKEALSRASIPLRAFMLRQTREKDLGLMVSLAKGKRPRNADDLPMTTIIPAFMISEVSTAFAAGFIIFIPFLIIDMVVACVLLSMGMMMLPPVMVSLPFKILLFVLVDGWGLLIGSVVKSFN
ncbi:MAG: flagellar type III secretion system pore protein FliP [Deltaproteobacteria bacterium]|nr:flagellar type III secretion system pore protein FliP [Deltaproteobacteria bacterium]